MATPKFHPDMNQIEEIDASQPLTAHLSEYGMY